MEEILVKENHEPQKNNLKQYTAPISDAMDNYARDGALAFHTPGHKQGLGAHPRLQRLITPQGLKQEVSLMEELDDLHGPEGCIKEAQELAAQLWDARESFFIINGTTGAIQAMLLGTLSPGDKVLLPRNAHRSIVGGVILAGLIPAYVEPEQSVELGIALGLSYNAVAKAIKANPEAKALVAVYPVYYGYGSDLTSLAQLVHQHNMLLLVDEAHGAHLKFSSELPQQALDCGADVVAQSTHKLLGSMTQTSMLHIGKNSRVESSAVAKAAGLLQSTSPNQLLLASLDIARLQMAQEGRERLAKALELSRWLREKVGGIAGLKSPGVEYCQDGLDSGACCLDETKVMVDVQGLGITGMEAEYQLRYTYKVQCELSDPQNLLFIISMADTKETVTALVQALQQLSDQYHGQLATGQADRGGKITQGAIPSPQQAMSPREAFFATDQAVLLEEAVGKIAGETVAFYPPGIPVLCPGEIITAEVVAYIRYHQSLGLRVSGAADNSLKYIRIIGETNE